MAMVCEVVSDSLLIQELQISVKAVSFGGNVGQQIATWCILSARKCCFMASSSAC